MRLVAVFVAGVVALASVASADGDGARDHRRTIKTRDALLFVGDSLVAQSAWTRESGVGILGVRQGEQIRLFTASWAGAIVAGGTEEVGRGRMESAILWVPRVTLTTRPTVMVVALGWDDALRHGGPEGEAFEREFERGLESVVTSVRHRVRELFLVTPPNDAAPGALGDRERARLAAVGAATSRVAGRHEAGVIALHEGRAAEALRATWEEASGVRLEGAASVVAASFVLEAMGYSGEELTAFGWAACPEPTFARAQAHLAAPVEATPAQMARAFGMAGALSAYEESFDLAWRQLEMRLAVTNEHREDMLGRQRMQVELDWVAVEQSAAVEGAGARAP